MFTDSHLTRRLAVLAAAVSLGTLVALASAASTHAQAAPRCDGQPATIWGTDGPDILLGTFGDDVIHGLGGNDTIYALGGNDVICGSDGDDSIYGVSGDNLIFGDAGNDFLYGGAWRDIINAGPGDDTVFGGDGDDTLHGGDDDDTLHGGFGDDTLHGGDGNDTLNAAEGDDTLHGENGNDLLNGHDGNDALTGDDDDDTLNGGNGEDRLDGGSGADMLRGGNGEDALDGGPGDDSLFGDVDNDFLQGGVGEDLMDGGPGEDRIHGDNGRDTILGGDNADVIDGGADPDFMIGGPGEDILEAFYPDSDVMIDLNPDDRLQIPSSETCDTERQFSVALPLFNDTGVNLVRTQLRDMICPGDTLALISGNKDGAFRGDWVNHSGAALARELPGVKLVTLTSGLRNIGLAALTTQRPVEYVGYIYEPNWENMPEFDWDFSRTMANLEAVNGLVKARGLKTWTKPTGRPLLQSYLFKYEWDYGKIGRRMDGMAVQAQTYCKDGPARYAQAMDKLLKEYAEAGVTYKWYAQIAINNDGYNTVSVPEGLACAREASQRMVPGVFIWWATDNPGNMIEFLKGLGR